MRSVLWTISFILIVIDVFNLGARMERALIDTADHIDVNKEGWERVTTDVDGKETPYADKWGRRSMNLILAGSAVLIVLGLLLKVTELPSSLVNTVAGFFLTLSAIGLLLFACLMILTAAPHVLGAFSVVIKSLARQKRGVIGSVGLSIGIIGLFF